MTDHSLDASDQGDLVEIPVLATPSEGVPAVVDNSDECQVVAERLGQGHGPVAVDTERAQGFRYSAQAYLLQFRRQGAGTVLVDPVGLGDADFATLRAGMADAEWIIHAASQDLPCLSMVGLVPDRVFDTELAGRLLGFPRVNLGTLVEHFFGVRLLKEHSAANWSQRPIPTDWLNYAALDVELLIELADRLREELATAGKDQWARQECEALLRTDWSITIDPERWRRTSGLHQVRSRAGLAIVRELWITRDELAQRLDLAPGRLVADLAITELAATAVSPRPTIPTAADLEAVPGFRRRQARRWMPNWTAALDRVREMTPSQYPPTKITQPGPPPPRTWQQRDPAAWTRWNQARPAVNQLAAELKLPPENLLTPDYLRRLTWQPPDDLSSAGLAQALASYGARPWQCELVAPALAAAFGEQTTTTST